MNNFDKAAYQVAAVSIPKSTKRKVEIVLPVRDMLQSYGLAAPMHHPNLLAVYELIGKFNADITNSHIKIAALEGWSGALPQKDMMIGRGEILRPLRETAAVLSDDIPQRFLVRGPFGVRLSAMHPKDLRALLTNMANAAGANIGRPVIFKLFEAQNTVEEHTKTLKIIRALRNQGHNVKVELAVCFTDSARLDAEYYRKTTQAILDNAITIDRGAIAGVSLKDMIGMMNAETGENLAKVVTGIIQEKLPGAYFALHTHKEETAAATIGAAKFCFGSEGIGQFRFDALPGGFGFPDVFKALEGMGESLSERQHTILNEIQRNLSTCIAQYHFDRSGFWTSEQLIYGRVPGGAVPTAKRDVVDPLVKIFAQLEQKPSQTTCATEHAKYERLIGDLFIHVNRQLAEDCGEAHSVTPAANNLGLLAKEVMQGMIADPTFRGKLLASEINLELGNSEIGKTVRNYYDHIRLGIDKTNEAINYFRGKMPFPVDAKLMDVLCRNSIKLALPGFLASVSEIFKKHGLSDRTKYLGTHLELLDAYPTDKVYARKTLMSVFFLREIAKYAGWPNVPGVHPSAQQAYTEVTQSIAEFVHEHVGQRETLFDHNATEQLPTIRSLISTIPVEALRVPAEDAETFVLLRGKEAYGVQKGPRGENVPYLNPDVVRGIMYPIDQFPTYHPSSPVLNAEINLYGNGFGITESERALIDALRENNVRTLQQLREKRGQESTAVDLYRHYLGEPITRTYLFKDWVGPAPTVSPATRLKPGSFPTLDYAG